MAGQKTLPLVCICIPNYNSEGTIRETIESLLAQTYKNIIIKIFDNASTDGSMQILKEYELKYKNVKVFQNETNTGGANFTKCMQNAEGKYTAVFHSDDVYLPTIIEEQVRFLEMHEECAAVSTHAYKINSASERVGEMKLPNEIREKPFEIFDNTSLLFKAILKYGNFIVCPSVMSRSEIYKNKICFWNEADYKAAMDIDVWLRLAEFGGFGVISKPLMLYRYSVFSYSYKNNRRRIEEDQMFLVLNSYMNDERYKKFLTKKDINSYNFLLFKDRVSRTINMITQDGKQKKLPISAFDKNIIRAAFYTKHNMKIYLIGIAVLFLRYLYLPKFIKNQIYKIRFKRA